MRDRRHRPMSHDDSYGPQLYIPAGCSGEVARPSGQFLGIGKTRRGAGAGAGAGDSLVKPGPGDTASNCYFCTKDGLLMQKRTHASSLSSFQT